MFSFHSQMLFSGLLVMLLPRIVLPGDSPP
jgi:hypothetical protein